MVELTVSRRFTWVVASIVALGAAVACGDDGGDGDVSDDDAGSGGMPNAGRGGGGRGGSSPTSGRGGTENTAGSLGVAGTAAGTTGSGGDPGTAGTSGSSSGGTSSGGTSPTGGTAGTTNTPDAGTGGTVDPVGGSGGDGGTAGEAGGGLGGAGNGGQGGASGGAGGDGGSGGSVDQVVIDYDVTVSPLLFPLAPGGVNIVQAQFVNSSTVPIDITLAAAPSTGATVDLPTQPVDLDIGETVDAFVVVRGTDVATGNGTVTLTASTDGLADKAKTANIVFSDDMARNDLGSLYPKAIASSFQTTQPPGLAFDGLEDVKSGTFWVSAGTAEGQGPLPAQPEWLGVDFGASVTIGRVNVIPREDRGPTIYDIEVSDDAEAWTVAESVSTTDKRAIIDTIVDPPRTARYVRLLITGSNDPGGPSCPNPCDPPRNVQIIALRVYKQ